MTQTFDLDVNPSAETLSADLKQTTPRASAKNQRDTLVAEEATGNPPKKACRRCQNTGIHVGLHATDPAVSKGDAQFT